MSIYLVQHGKCFSEDIDPERSLTEDGIIEVKAIAERAKAFKVRISAIKQSGKKRAFQTAEIFQQITGSSGGISEQSGMNPSDDVVTFAAGIADDDSMIVGHLPFMSRLTSYLVTGDANMPVFRFQNAGILCLESNPDTGRWIIRWSLMPGV